MPGMSAKAYSELNNGLKKATRFAYLALIGLRACFGTRAGACPARLVDIHKHLPLAPVRGLQERQPHLQRVASQRRLLPAHGSAHLHLHRRLAIGTETAEIIAPHRLVPKIRKRLSAAHAFKTRTVKSSRRKPGAATAVAHAREAAAVERLPLAVVL
jgi:hypothetical protein